MSLLVELLASEPQAPSEVDGRVVLLNLLHELNKNRYRDLRRLARLLRTVEKKLQEIRAAQSPCTAELAVNALVEHAERDGEADFWAAGKPKPAADVVRVVTQDDLWQHLLDSEQLSRGGFGDPGAMDEETLYGAINRFGQPSGRPPLRVGATVRGRRAFSWVTLADVVNEAELWSPDGRAIPKGCGTASACVISIPGCC